MSGLAPPTEHEIHAYVDGALDPARREEVDAILRRDDGLAARVAAYCADRDALRQALSGIMTQSLPQEWQARIEGATRRRGLLSRRRAVAAGLALMVSAGAGTALLRRQGGGILQDALAARESGLGAAVPAGEAGALQNARLAAALGLNVRAPDLRHFGFQLARLEVSQARTAQMDYRDAAGRRLTIYVRPSDGTVRFDLLRRGPARVCVWQDDVVGAVIIAPMSAGEMMRVASSAYAALNL